MVQKLTLFVGCLLFMLSSVQIQAEGSRELITAAAHECGLSLNDKGQFAYPGLPYEKRLHIAIGDPTCEEICVALATTAWYVRLVSPDGLNTYVYDGTGFVAGGTPALWGSGGSGVISTYAENELGPNGVTQPGAGAPTVGSYNSVCFQPNVAGDWYIEMTDQPAWATPTVSVRAPYWDITVADKCNANTAIPGRIWSLQYSLRSGPGSAPPGPGPRLDSKFYVLTDDCVVTSLNVGDSANPGWGGDWTIACNDFGTDPNEPDPTIARQSYDGEADADLGFQGQYKIFVNEPDINLFPTCVDSLTVDAIAIDQCIQNADYFITFVTNTSGVGDIIIDVLPYGLPSGPEDIVYAQQAVSAGATTVQWDGLDGNGVPVPAGALVMTRFYIGGSIVHFPMFDMEGNTGLTAQLVRPGAAGTIPMYWDNSPLVPADVNLVGCNTPPCNAYGYGNNETINTWWVGLETSVDDVAMIPSFAPIDVEMVGPPQMSACASDTVPVDLSVSLTNTTIAQWSGGSGTFANPNDTATTYLPSAADIAAGQVYLKVASASCGDICDSVLVVFDGICPLPIELSHFAGEEVDCNVEVVWITETEEMTAQFVLERSENGVVYTEVGTVPAAGHSTERITYTMMDNNPSAVNYYRLVEVTTIGERFIHNMPSTVVSKCHVDIVDAKSIKFYPNPTSGTLKLSVFSSENHDAQIHITDQLGRVVKVAPISLKAGSNLTPLEISDMKQGIYFFELKTSSWHSSPQRILILN